MISDRKRGEKQRKRGEHDIANLHTLSRGCLSENHLAAFGNHDINPFFRVVMKPSETFS